MSASITSASTSRVIDDWWPAKRAWNYARASLGKERARAALNSWLSEGQLLAWHWRLVEELDSGPISPVPASEVNGRILWIFEADEPCRLFIGGAFWISNFTSPWVEDPWSWETGVFASLISPHGTIRLCNIVGHRPAVRFVAYGVHFLKTEILDIVRKSAPFKSTKPSSDNSRFSGSWSDILTPLYDMTNEKFQETFGFPNTRGLQAAIERHIAGCFDEGSNKSPSTSTIRRRVRKLLDDRSKRRK